ncbi:MAG: MFS transporter [Alphaproteobacteria bacterium]
MDFKLSVNRKYFIFSMPLIFFTLQFLLRVAPGVLTEDVMNHFSMNASKFGIFASCYYIGYAAMQIPIGILLDNFHPRKVIAGGILLCALASIGLVITDNWILGSFYRFLIGSCSVVGFIGCAKVIKEIFPLNLYNKMISVTFSVGFIGATLCFLISYKSKELNFASGSWRYVFIYTALILIIISLISWKSLKIIPEETKTDILEKLKIVIKDKYIIIIGIAGGLMVGAFDGLADVWGNSFLKKAYRLSDFQAVCATSSIYLGIGIGAPLIAYFADKIRNYLLVTWITGLITTLLLLIIIWSQNLSPISVIFVCLTIGILSSNQVLIFSMTSMRVSSETIAVTAALTNSLVMIFGLFFHSLIGFIMDYFWSGATLNGQKIYDINQYQLALSIIPLSCLIGAITLIYNKKQITLLNNS